MDYLLERFRGQNAPGAAGADAVLRSLAHHGCVLGLNLVDHAHFRRLAIGVLVHAQILLGHFVDVLVSAAVP